MTDPDDWPTHRLLVMQGLHHARENIEAGREEMRTEVRLIRKEISDIRVEVARDAGRIALVTTVVMLVISAGVVALFKSLGAPA